MGEGNSDNDEGLATARRTAFPEAWVSCFRGKKESDSLNAVGPVGRTRPEVETHGKGLEAVERPKEGQPGAARGLYQCSCEWQTRLRSPPASSAQWEAGTRSLLIP